MSTTQQLLTLVDNMYPNSMSNSVKIAYMNMALDELSPYFGLNIEDDSLATVADQDSYAIPSGINDITEIYSFAVANQATVSSRYDFTEYKKAYRETNPVSELSYFQIVSSTGTKKLVITPVPTVSGYAIIIRYKKAVPQLSVVNLTESPEIDSRFHDLLALYACHMICASGASPDVVQANMFMQKFDDGMRNLRKFYSRQDDNTRMRRRDNPQWRRYRSYGRGD